MYEVTDSQELSVIDAVACSPWTQPGVVQSGGAGLGSTALDYIRFALMLAAGGTLDGVEILRESTVAAMSTNQLRGPEMPVRWDEGPGDSLGYGYGLGVSATEPRRIWLDRR